jgi:hypothetical protein
MPRIRIVISACLAIGWAGCGPVGAVDATGGSSSVPSGGTYSETLGGASDGIGGSVSGGAPSEAAGGTSGEFSGGASGNASGGISSSPLDGGSSAPALSDAGSTTVPIDGGFGETDYSYTVTLRGAVVAPFDDFGDAWDLLATASDVDKTNLRTVRSDYTSARKWVQDVAGFWDAPEVYGDARLSVGAYPEQAVTLQSANLADSTFLPKWSAGWKHVRILDSLQILVSLYDADVSTPDAISYILLGATDLRGVARLGGSTALPVYDRTNNRVLWLEIDAQREEADAGEFAPASINGPDVTRDPNLEVPSLGSTTLWIRGLDFSGGADVVLPWGDWSYWAQKEPGPNPIAINYHARAYLGVSNVVVQYALNRYCLAPDSCIIACHSAGCSQIGFSLATNGILGTRWTISRVIGGGSAAGGSELADDAAFTGIAGFLGHDLEVARMRGLYDHDALGVQVDLNVGANGSSSLGSLIGSAIALIGEDDGAVAYHSSGGARQALAYCNATGWFCDAVLPVNSFDVNALFVGHRVVFRDDEELIDHAGTKKKVAEWVAQEYPSP